MFNPKRCASLDALDSVTLSLNCLPIVGTTCVVAVKILRVVQYKPRWTKPFVEEPKTTLSLVETERVQAHSWTKEICLFLVLLGLTTSLLSGLSLCWSVVTGLSTVPWVMKPRNHLQPALLRPSI